MKGLHGIPRLCHAHVFAAEMPKFPISESQNFASTLRAILNSTSYINLLQISPAFFGPHHLSFKVLPQHFIPQGSYLVRWALLSQIRWWTHRRQGILLLPSTSSPLSWFCQGCIITNLFLQMVRTFTLGPVTITLSCLVLFLELNNSMLIIFSFPLLLFTPSTFYYGKF